MGKIIWRRDAPPQNVPPRNGAARFAVAIPARDEARLVGACLRALNQQQDGPEFVAAIVLNNCRDETGAEVAKLEDELRFALHVFQVELDGAHANAAWARRLAMNAAAGLVGADGFVLTSDADSRVDGDWLAATQRSFAAGVDVVCGFVAPDFNDAPPLAFEALHKGALEFEYSQLTAELITLAAPAPHDPWPTHLIETGANLAIRADLLAALGGVPHVCPGEDAALVAMAQRAGARVRHEFASRVTTSSRVRGRAAGGWSEDLHARLSSDRGECHPRLEPARLTLRRWMTKGRLRDKFGAPEFHEHVARLVPDAAARARIDAARHFAEAWGLIEDHSPALRRQPLLAAHLAEEVARLRGYVQRLSRPQGAAQDLATR